MLTDTRAGANRISGLVLFRLTRASRIIAIASCPAMTAAQYAGERSARPASLGIAPAPGVEVRARDLGWRGLETRSSGPSWATRRPSRACARPKTDPHGRVPLHSMRGNAQHDPGALEVAERNGWSV